MIHSYLLNCSACDVWFLLHILNSQYYLIYFKIYFLGVSDIKLPACTTVSEGHKVSLTVKCDLDAELDNKVNSCIKINRNV